MKYLIVLFKNKKRKKILNKFKTLERANLYFEKLIFKNKEIKFGSVEDIEIARQLSQRSYLELDTVLKIHKITAKKWHSHSKKDDSPKYWEYLCYGGDEGKSWAENIIKIYLTKEWKIN